MGFLINNLISSNMKQIYPCRRYYTNIFIFEGAAFLVLNFFVPFYLPDVPFRFSLSTLL